MMPYRSIKQYNYRRSSIIGPLSPFLPKESFAGGKIDLNSAHGRPVMVRKKVIRLLDGMTVIVPPGTEAEIRTEPRMSKRMEISGRGDITMLKGIESTVLCAQDHYIKLEFSVKNRDKRVYELSVILYPAHSSELNPINELFQEIYRKVANRLSSSSEEQESVLVEAIGEYFEDKEKIKQLCAYLWIIEQCQTQTNAPLFH